MGDGGADSAGGAGREGLELSRVLVEGGEWGETR